MIKRSAQSECMAILKQFPVLGIVGPRQCGKTTLAKQLMQLLDKETIYIDLENPRDLARLTDAELYLSQNKDRLIVLDEIQHRSDLFDLLRSSIDELRVPSRFIILGSGSPELLRDSADSLAGRIAYIELCPFSYSEVPHEVTVYEHWLRGGYPDALLTQSQKETQRWLKNYLKTYIERDLGLLGLNISPSLANRLLSMLSHVHGQLSNFSQLGRSLDITSNTVKRYLDFLSESFIIRGLAPFYRNVKKRLIKSPKLYYRDSGLLHYLYRVDDYDQLLGHPGVGSSWEGYVIEEIYRNLGEEYELFFYRTQKGAECDLLLCQNYIPKLALEIKLSNSPKVSRGFFESIKDLETTENFVITPETDRYPLGGSVEAISLMEFLSITLPNTSDH